MLLHKESKLFTGHRAGRWEGFTFLNLVTRTCIPVMLAFGLLIISLPSASAQNSISIRASATVVEATGIELIPMKDMIIDESSAQDGMLDISPVTDDKAGKILVKGKSNSSVRLTYMNEMLLVNTAGDGTLVCRYSVSGYKTDNQRASQLLDMVERVVQFSEKGEFYLWLGGKVDLSRAKPGNYDGEFTIQIEYI